MRRFRISNREALRLIRDLYFFIDPGCIRNSNYGLKSFFSKLLPRLYFLIFGLIQKSNPNQYFHAADFASKFPLGSLSFRFPVFKYLISSTGQRPQIGVDSRYLSNYPDVRSFPRSPLTHFFRYGKSEGRSADIQSIERISHENRLWYVTERNVHTKREILILIDSCKGVDYFLETSDTQGEELSDVAVIEATHNHGQEFTPLSNIVRVEIEGHRIIVKYKTHRDLIFERKHASHFLHSLFSDSGYEDPNSLEYIESYFHKLSYEPQKDFYMSGNQTFSARFFTYLNPSRNSLSIARRGIEMKTPHKILLISHDNTLSGAPLFALQIYKQMVSQGFLVQLLVLKRVSATISKSAFSDPGIDVLYLEDILPDVNVQKGSNSTESDLAVAYNAIFVNFKPDVVIANTVMSADPAVRASAAGILTVLLVHEIWDFTLKGHADYSPQEVAIRESFQSVNLVVFGSKAAREKFRDPEITPNSLVLPSIRVLSQITNIKPSERIELRQELGIPENAFVFLSIGSFEERKRTLDAIHAFIALSSSEVFMVLVGDWSIIDSYCRTVRNLAAKFSNIKTVETTPSLEKYYLTADCFIFMSSNEVYPLVLQEAAAYGLPRIISKFDGFRECVKSLNSALFYEIGDLMKLTELMGLIRDRCETREAIIHEAQAEVQNNEMEASQYIDRILIRLAYPHITSVRKACND